MTELREYREGDTVEVKGRRLWLRGTVVDIVAGAPVVAHGSETNGLEYVETTVFDENSIRRPAPRPNFEAEIADGSFWNRFAGE